MVKQNWLRQIPLFSTIFLGLVLRLYQFYRDFSFDEAFTILITRQTTPMEIIQNMINDTTPPLYYLLIYIWQKVLPHFQDTRIFSLLTGLLGIYLMYYFGEKLFSKRVGLIAAIINATTPLSIYNSQNARMYTLGFIWSAYLTYVLIKIYTSKNPLLSQYFILGLILLLGLFTHYFFVFYGTAILCFAFFDENARRQKRIIFCLFSILIIFLPWAVLISVSPHADYISENNLFKIPLSIITQFVSIDQIGGLWQASALTTSRIAKISMVTFFILLPLVIKMYLVLKRKEEERIPKLLFFLVATTFLSTIFVSYTIMPIMSFHGFSIFTPALYLLLAYLVSTYALQLRHFILSLFVILSVGINLWFTRGYTYSSQQTARILLEKYKAGDSIYYGDIIPLAPLLVYVPQLPQYLLFDNPSVSKMTAQHLGITTQPFAISSSESSRIWIIYDTTTYRAITMKTIENEKNSEWHSLFKYKTGNIRMSLYASSRF